MTALRKEIHQNVFSACLGGRKPTRCSNKDWHSELWGVGYRRYFSGQETNLPLSPSTEVTSHLFSDWWGSFVVKKKKKPSANTEETGDWGSVPGAGRSPGIGDSSPLQYSCLENPWTEEPGGLLSVGSQRIGDNWVHTYTYWSFQVLSSHQHPNRR